MMKKLLLWIPSVPYLLFFGFILCVFHVLQIIAIRLGYKTHNAVVTLMIVCLNLNKWWLASPIKFNNYAGKRNQSKPTIIISNHQSMFDIPAIGWILRKHHPKYVAKKELAFGIPGISYNIRNGGCIYIDRAKPLEAINKIKKFNTYIKDNNYASILFAEGTRSRDGKVKPFKKKGFEQMLKDIPNALIVPVAIKNLWHLEKYGLKPLPFGINMSCTILPAISTEGKSIDVLVAETEAIIKQNVET